MPIMGRISDDLHRQFGDRAYAGTKGEQFTADELAKLFERDQTTWVFHDLVPPGWKSANLDHVVCRGNTVVVLDSKCWAPGRYWSMGELFIAASNVLARLRKFRLVSLIESLSNLLGPGFAITPLVVIWPSRPGRVSTRYPLLSMRLPLNTPYCTGRRLAPVLRRILVRMRVLLIPTALTSWPG